MESSGTQGNKPSTLKPYVPVADLTRLIEDLLELNQLESRRTAFDPQHVDVLDLVEKLFSKYEHDIERAGLRPRLMLPESSGGEGRFYVNVDPDRIDRVLSNLIFNSAKFANKGGDLAVGCSVSPRRQRSPCVITGPESPKKTSVHLRQVLQVSEVKDCNARKRAGAINSQEIVALHDGRIWVESKVGEGTTFYFTLPRFYAARG